MRTGAAAAGSSLFFAVAPGVVAGVVPWLLTGWVGADPPWPVAVRVAGGALLVACTLGLVLAFVRLVAEGRGTPAPVGPTERLVVGGLYRHVRNPMYVAVVGAIVGQALVIGRPALFAYAAVVATAMALFVHLYEEPHLTARYGDQYRTYRHAVPGWLPRLTPWTRDDAA